MEFCKTDAKKRKVSVKIEGDHELVETLHTDVITRMTHSDGNRAITKLEPLYLRENLKRSHSLLLEDIEG